MKNSPASTSEPLFSPNGLIFEACEPDLSLTEKRPVAKEDIRVRKDTVQDEELVEEDVRREEVDVEDQTDRRGGSLGHDADDETKRRGR